MAHKVHPHGENKVHIHELNDHLFPGQGKNGSLPDSARETWMHEDSYPNQPEHNPGTTPKETTSREED